MKYPVDTITLSYAGTDLRVKAECEDPEDPSSPWLISLDGLAEEGLLEELPGLLKMLRPAPLPPIPILRPDPNGTGRTSHSCGIGKTSHPYDHLEETKLEE